MTCLLRRRAVFLLLSVAISRDTRVRHSEPDSSALRQDNGDDEAIEGESLGKDHHENECDQDISLTISANASITNDANAKASSKVGESTAQASTELSVGNLIFVAPIVNFVCEGIVCGVDLANFLGRKATEVVKDRRDSLTSLLHKNGDDHAVHTKNTGHDDWNNRFEQKG